MKSRTREAGLGEERRQVEALAGDGEDEPLNGNLGELTVEEVT